LELQNALLQEENHSLAQEYPTLLEEDVKKKQQIRKQVLAIASSKDRLSSCSFAT
jgi:hypothetical protein